MVAPFPLSFPAPDPARLARAAVARQEALHDAGLVRRFNAGESAAFDEIVARYHAKMFRAALVLLRNHSDSEEIAQDTFVRAHRGLARFRGDSSLSAWLHCIALNLARNRYWHSRRRHTHRALPLEAPMGDETTGTFADLISSGEPSPVQCVVTQEFSTLVAACMTRLTAAQREILELSTGRHHTYQEIAGILGLRVGTVKSRIARARGNLRELLARLQAAEFRSHRPAHLSEWFEPDRPASRLTGA